MSARRNDSGRLNSSGNYSLKTNIPYWFTCLVWKYTGMGMSEKAKIRLAFLEFYKIVRDVSVVCKSFKISRTTFYKWQGRFNPKELKSLEEKSKAPKTKRQGLLTLKEKEVLKRYREKYIRIGKMKLSVMYKNEHNVKYSPHQFQKIIEKYNLYFDKAKKDKIRTKRDKGRGRVKIRVHQVNPKGIVSTKKPYFFCVDSIVLCLPWGIKRYILTAYDYFHEPVSKLH